MEAKAVERSATPAASPAPPRNTLSTPPRPPAPAFIAPAVALPRKRGLGRLGTAAFTIVLLVVAAFVIRFATRDTGARAPAVAAAKAPLADGPSTPVGTTQSPPPETHDAIAAETVTAPTAPSTTSMTAATAATTSGKTEAHPAPPAEPALPPMLVNIATPASVVVGKPFSLTMWMQRGGDEMASIERRVIDSVPKAAVEDRTTPMSGLESLPGGAWRYPVEAIRTASRSTVEFTVVDRDGARSAPRRVVIEAVAVASEARAVACSRSTCGSIVAVRDAETGAEGAALAKTGARNKPVEVIVRTDDRGIHALVAQGRWKVGARVRLDGARLVAADARVAASRPSSLPEGKLLPESVPIVDQ